MILLNYSCNLFEGVGEAFVINDPNSPQAKACIQKIIGFLHREPG